MKTNLLFGETPFCIASTDKNYALMDKINHDNLLVFYGVFTHFLFNRNTYTEILKVCICEEGWQGKYHYILECSAFMLHD